MLVCFVCLFFGSNPRNAVVCDLLGWLFIRNSVQHNSDASRRVSTLLLLPRLYVHVCAVTRRLPVATSPRSFPLIGLALLRLLCRRSAVVSAGCLKPRHLSSCLPSTKQQRFHATASSHPRCREIYSIWCCSATRAKTMIRRDAAVFSLFFPFFSTLACRRATLDPPPPWAGY